ncbi:DUF485 domain-containing protein [Kitasatospora aureofaciens]|uniref:DUF485 domain-containing protein n=1 Tax=Kitasatospora aureofaciens TaxID=1894 RepID=A0A1E7NDT6_KITAU|nr:DUF485 domain-containing protein [Kitasatospora aureofaciens]ARF81237.1 hypothetical protein B6264_22140 [Kitasatospora aureofaciens]OEV38834.1 hypothetical protein HS99_0019405 [Kitasatospora aureofaciens]GGU90500.1 hypothetical protein GCM10010502_49770 [Kitasatospora aureofaciens]
MNSPTSPNGSSPADQSGRAGTDAVRRDTASAVFEEAQSSPSFGRLRRSQRTFATLATIAVLSLYLLYVLLSSYARDLMDARVVGRLNVAFFLGLAQFGATFLTAWLYTRHADRRRDPVAEQVRQDIERVLVAGSYGSGQTTGVSA